MFDPVKDLDKLMLDNDLEINEVCALAGVHPATYYRWLDQDPKTVELLRAMFEAVEVLRKR